jgi:hypothetical protein
MKSIFPAKPMNPMNNIANLLKSREHAFNIVEIMGPEPDPGVQKTSLEMLKACSRDFSKFAILFIGFIGLAGKIDFMFLRTLKIVQKI